MKPLRVGTRGSDLALWQTHHVASEARRAAAQAGEELQVAVEIITTRGDVDPAERLVGKLEKGFFTEELEAALREGRIDFAVHSLKDLPTRMPEGLALGAVLPRARPVDLLIAKPEAVEDRGPAELPIKRGCRIGASSLRRDSLIRKYAAGVEPIPFRGNVPTRIQKLRDGKADAILLAAAGVERLALDLGGLVAFDLNQKRWPGAPGQGAIAAQCRAGDAPVLKALGRLHHAATAEAVHWERAFLRVLEGGCATPFACYVEAGRAWFGQQKDGRWHSGSVPLPPLPEGPARDEFITRVLEGRERIDGDDDSWLFRKK